MEEYCALLLKIGCDAPIKVKAISNLEHLVCVNVLPSLSFVLLFLEVLHNIIKFNQM
jgi:hypothetical protein